MLLVYNMLFSNRSNAANEEKQNHKLDYETTCNSLNKT